MDELLFDNARLAMVCLFGFGRIGLSQIGFQRGISRWHRPPPFPTVQAYPGAHATKPVGVQGGADTFRPLCTDWLVAKRAEVESLEFVSATWDNLQGQSSDGMIRSGHRLK